METISACLLLALWGETGIKRTPPEFETALSRRLQEEIRTAFQFQKHKGGINETEIWGGKKKKFVGPSLARWCLLPGVSFYGVH